MRRRSFIKSSLVAGAAVPVHLDTSNGECIIFSARSGHKYLISRNA